MDWLLVDLVIGDSGSLVNGYKITNTNVIELVDYLLRERVVN